jgi:hypothetical protein
MMMFLMPIFNKTTNHGYWKIVGARVFDRVSRLLVTSKAEIVAKKNDEKGNVGSILEEET